MTSKTEAAVIRSKLSYRFNHVENCPEVYTTIHGSGVFKWMRVSPEALHWYRITFPEIKKSPDVHLHSNLTGAITA